MGYQFRGPLGLLGPIAKAARIVDEGDQAIFLAGDSSNTQDLMLRGVADGVSPNEVVARQTHGRIRAFAAERATVYLVAHDHQTGVRLRDRQTIDAAVLKIGA